MDDEADRRAKLRDRLHREAAEPAEPARVPGRTTLVEQLFSPRQPTTSGIPGKATLVSQQYAAAPGAQVDVHGVIAQARDALAGGADHDRAYEALVEALASHAGALPREQATEMMSLCIDMLRSRNAPQPTDIATRGVAAASAELPFYDEIQASFGRHDVSGIRAQVGGAAATATNALGARAYATGNRVAFAGSPDLHTAAHEAAHVVQQRAGVSLKGIDGGSSDPHEQQADDVADAVVAGRRAEPLLDRIASGGGGTAVQRKGEAAPAKSAQAPKDDVAWAYLRANQDKFLVAIENRLRIIALPTDERLTWIANGVAARFRQALMTTLAGAELWNDKLRELVHPADPWYSIDLHRPLTDGTAGVVVDGREPKGSLEWTFLAGEAVATDVQRALAASFVRMIPRFLVQVDAKRPQPVTADSLVTSHPMDGVAALLLCDDKVVTVKGTAAKADAKHVGHGKHEAKEQPTDHKLFKEGVRFLQNWRWLGSTDPKLWNWIEAIEPRDATPEDVAATLWLDKDASKYAYGITASGPYFRIDPTWARRFSPDAKFEIDKPHEDNALDLADSSIASEAAIAQAAGEKRVDKQGHALPPDLKALSETLDRSARQLDRAKELLGETKLWELVLPAIHWVTRYREGLTSVASERLGDLTPAIEGQSEVLFEAVGAVTDVMQMAGNAKALTGANNPVLDVLREYAVSIGESHLIESARAHLARARKAKADLPLALLEISANDTAIAARDSAASGHDYDPDNLTDIDRRRISDMRTKQAAGQNVDPSAVAYVAARLKERSTELRVHQLYDQLSDLGNLARDAQFGFFETLASAFDSNIRALPDLIYGALHDLDDTVLKPHEDAKANELAKVSSEADKAVVLQSIAQRTEKNLDAFIAKYDLKRRMSIAMGVIEKQERRAAIIRVVTQIAILIGASVVGGIAGNMVAGAVRGALIADAASASVGLVRAANVVGAVAGLSVDAGINASAQLAVQGGGSAKEAFIGNFLASGAVRIALAPLTRAAQTWGKASEEIENANVWQKVGHGAKIAVREGATLTTAMITGAATDYVVQRIYHSDEPPTEKQAVDWAIQGGSLVIGAFVGRWVHDFESRAVQYAENQGQLLARARKMNAISAEIAKAPTEQAALELLIQRQEALQEEAKIIDEYSRNPSAHPNMKASTLEALRAGNASESAQVRDAAFASVPLRLAGLTPDDASGAVWTGHRAQIDSAIEQSRRAQIPVDVVSHDEVSGRWELSYNGQRITVLEVKVKSAVVLAGEDTELRDIAANIKPLPGWRDVVLHGTVDDFEVLVNGKFVAMDHRALTTWLRKQGVGNERIRLLSCDTGKHPKGAAQHLANKYGAEVMAPNDKLHVFEDGSMVIGPTDKRNTGSWETYKPQKASRRFNQPRDAMPERAIDRYHRTKGATSEATSTMLGDDNIAKPQIGNTTDLSDARVRGADYAEKAGERVGGNLEQTVKDVVLASTASDIQVEAGLRVLDRVFGKATSNEFKRAAKTIESEHDESVREEETRLFTTVDDARDRIGKEMLDVMRDPAIDIESRKAQLRTKLAEFEGLLKQTPRLDSTKIPIAEARKQIDALRADTFEDMIAVDSSGNLSQRGKRIGTLRELMNKVQATNAAFRRHGIEQEFVIAVSSPEASSVTKEVKVLSRPTRSEANAKNRRPPVDASNQEEPGEVVDIGVGQSDYARDVGGETGQVVKTEYGGNYTDPAMLRRDLHWKHTGTQVDVDSVLVLGDALQTLPMMFADRSVKRVFINNINAHYVEGSDQYLNLAKGLRRVMKPAGRVEVQWTSAPENTGGKVSSRGHIDGPALEEALLATASDVPRSVHIDRNAPPVKDYDYTVEAPRTESGIPSKAPPSSPVPDFRWVITFED